MLVHGTTSNYLSFRFVEPLLGKHFTLYAVDRRGRGESGDAPEYAIEREFEDLSAVVDSSPAGRPARALLRRLLRAGCRPARAQPPQARAVRAVTRLLRRAHSSAIERIEELILRGDRDRLWPGCFVTSS